MKLKIVVEDFIIDYKELDVDKEIVGKGAFGIVYKGHWRGGQVAISMIMCKDLLIYRAIANKWRNI